MIYMIRLLICLVAGTLFGCLIFGSYGCTATLAQSKAAVETRTTVTIAQKSDQDLYVCGFVTDFDKYSNNMQCAPLDTFLGEFQKGLPPSTDAGTYNL